MKKAIVVFLLFFASQLHARAGFFLASSPEIIPEVASRVNSVYRIVIFAYEDGLEPAEKIQKMADSLPPSWQKGILEDLIDICRVTNRPLCRVPLPKSTGTVFLVDDQRTLWTARHVVDPQVKEWMAESLPKLASKAAKEAFLNVNRKNLRLRFALVNRRNKVVFNSLRPGADAYLNIVVPVMTEKVEEEVNPGDDAVSITLNHDLPDQPLTLAENNPAEQEEIYAIGYPRATWGRMLFGVSDSNGSDLYVTAGKVRKVVFKAENAKQEIQGKLNDLTNRVMFLDSDGDHGNSGGPILNDKGKVVGILVGALKLDLKALGITAQLIAAVKIERVLEIAKNFGPPQLYSSLR